MFIDNAVMDNPAIHPLDKACSARSACIPASASDPRPCSRKAEQIRPVFLVASLCWHDGVQVKALVAGSAGRLLAFLYVAAVAHGHTHIGVHSYAGDSSGHQHSSGGSKQSRRLLGSDGDVQGSPGVVDPEYPLKHGRKCGVDNISAPVFNRVQSAILTNWLIRNSVRSSGPIAWLCTCVHVPHAPGRTLCLVDLSGLTRCFACADKQP